MSYVTHVVNKSLHEPACAEEVQVPVLQSERSTFEEQDHQVIFESLLGSGRPENRSKSKQPQLPQLVLGIFCSSWLFLLLSGPVLYLCDAVLATGQVIFNDSPKSFVDISPCLVDFAVQIQEVRGLAGRANRKRYRGIGEGVSPYAPTSDEEPLILPSPSVGRGIR